MWYMPIIPAAKEAEIGGPWFETSTGKSKQDPISEIIRHGGAYLWSQLRGWW
jgi:hypothetical protein